MTRRAVLILTFAMASVLLVACDESEGGNGDPTPLTLSNERELTPIPATTELVLGPNRFAFGIIDNETNEPILDEGDVHLTFAYQSEPRIETDATFVWAIPGEEGYFVANVNFDDVGDWEGEAVVTRGERVQSVKFVFPVSAEGVAPNIGEPAPPTENLTLATQPDVRQISSDDTPNEAFYRMTVAEALGAGKPFVVAFATPAFCATRFCGPALDNVEAVWQNFGDRANFIHIEPYQLDEEGDLITNDSGAPVAAQPMLDWQLRTEPWMFVVDADGIIVARFEGTATPEELSEALNTALA
jgi:hypothetical protein